MNKLPLYHHKRIIGEASIPEEYFDLLSQVRWSAGDSRRDSPPRIVLRLENEAKTLHLNRVVLALSRIKPRDRKDRTFLELVPRLLREFREIAPLVPLDGEYANCTLENIVSRSFIKRAERQWNQPASPPHPAAPAEQSKLMDSTNDVESLLGKITRKDGVK